VAPGSRSQRLRARLSTLWFADNVQKPTRDELEAGHHHAEHEHELQSGLDHPADGHQFDGHHLVEEEHLRSH
jgi:ubiquinol-cytochrome c reductase cytochrome b subunit